MCCGALYLLCLSLFPSTPSGYRLTTIFIINRIIKNEEQYGHSSDRRNVTSPTKIHIRKDLAWCGKGTIVLKCGEVTCECLGLHNKVSSKGCHRIIKSNKSEPDPFPASAKSLSPFLESKVGFLVYGLVHRPRVACVPRPIYTSVFKNKEKF